MSEIEIIDWEIKEYIMFSLLIDDLLLQENGYRNFLHCDVTILFCNM